MIELKGRDLTIEALAAVAAGAEVRLSAEGLARMARTRAVIERAAAEGRPVYGVTTGLGPRVTEALPTDQLEAFALTTVRGRAHAAGPDLHERVCRAAAAVRANTFLIGAAGVRPELARFIADCLNAGLSPVMRSAGSIGAADLMHGGDFGLALIGEGRMWVRGEIRPAAEALTAAGLTGWTPAIREGLALVSHSAPSAALAALAVADAKRAFETAQTAAALSMEGFRANTGALSADLLALRPQAGQDAAAAGLRRRLEGSALNEQGAARRLQDPLSIRNLPQVHGAALAAIETACAAVEAEINGASDNPGVVAETGEVASHGGYLTPHLALTMGAMGQGLAMLAAAQYARVAKMLSARFSDLPPGLSGVGAAGAGLGPVMKTAEALVAEITRAAAPAPVWPGFSADGLEDVSVHTALIAREVGGIAPLMLRLSAIEFIVAAEAVEQRGLGAGLAPALRPVLAAVRAVAPPLADDRPLGDEIEALAETPPQA